MKSFNHIFMTFFLLLFMSLTIKLVASESKTIILKRELADLNTKNPKIDLSRKLDSNDFRFIGLYGYSKYFPGIKDDELSSIERYGSVMLEGTSDSIESDEHGKLIEKAEEYAKTYNSALLIYLKKHNFKPTDGYVPDVYTATTIAVAVWNKIYGEEKIKKQKPYIATLKDGIWYVSGTLPEGYKGGVALAEIIKESGKIIRVSHGK